MMNSSSTTIKYSLFMRIMHWLVALIVLAMLIVGFTMFHLKDENPIKWPLYDLHKSFGIIVLTLIVIRIIGRINSQVPSTPNGIGAAFDWTSKIVIFMMYVMLIIMPLSGFIGSQTAGYPVHFFGLLVPTFFAKNATISPIANDIHEFGGYFIATLIVLHILGTLYHLIIDKINLLKRIV